MTLFGPSTSTEIKSRVITDIVNSNAQTAYETLINYLGYTEKEAQVLENLDFRLNLINCDYFPTNENGLRNHCKKKGYNIKMINGSGHYPMIEKPEEFNKILDELLSES